MTKLITEFKDLKAGAGVIDIAIRVDTNTGMYELVASEDGNYTAVPANGLINALDSVANAVAEKFYGEDELKFKPEWRQ